MDRWFQITNKAEAQAEILLYDEIGGYGITAQDFIAELKDIKSEDINVRINSVGGEVYQGFAIYQALKNHPANINVTVDSLAASIASVIAMAGDKVIMARNAEMMIHDGQVAIQGDAARLSEVVDTLNRVSDNIASVYAERSGGNPEDWRNAMKKETWYSAEEAIAAGLADEIATASPRTARNVADLSIFNYAGRKFAPAPAIAARLDDDASSETNIDMEELAKALKKGLNIQ